jgi:hypothetical protein
MVRGSRSNEPEMDLRSLFCKQELPRCHVPPACERPIASEAWQPGQCAAPPAPPGFVRARKNTPPIANTKTTPISMKQSA